MKKSFLGMLLLFALFAVPKFSFADSAEDAQIKQSLQQEYDASKEIHARFVDRYYWDESPEVRIEVHDGLVTLRGFVENSLAKEWYEKIARETPGVKDVVVNIRVVPVERKVD